MTRRILVVMALFVGLAAIVLSLVLLGIRQGVRGFTAIAQEAHPHPGDDVAALLAFIDSPDHAVAGRNRAVWALGRLRDPRALPRLQALYTGEPCDHDSLLCQWELVKAIRMCGGEPTPEWKGHRWGRGSPRKPGER